MVSSLGNLCVCVCVSVLFNLFSLYQMHETKHQIQFSPAIIKKKRNLDSDTNIWIGIRPFGKIEKTNQTWVYCPTSNFCLY